MKGNLILDLQYGSTGKGLIAGYLAQTRRPDTVATAWAANAGHTFIDGAGRKYIHTMVANGVVSPNLRRLLIGPGSLIDPFALRRELESCRAHLLEVDILIHPHAAVITQEHRDLEAGPMTKIGSTKKGVGEAMIERIRRDPDKHNTAWSAIRGGVHPDIEAAGLAGFVCSAETYHNAWDAAREVLVEGAQGYSLSLYHGFYPFCTSRDVSTHQVLADVGIPARAARGLRVVGCARTYPIRVANRFDEAGNQVGYSGPCYSDQMELDWRADLGREPELTTVTKLPRRIFTMSQVQLGEAVRMCGADDVFLNFCNYVPVDKFRQFVRRTDLTVSRAGGTMTFLGFGPAVGDVAEYPWLSGDPATAAGLDPFDQWADGQYMDRVGQMA